MEGAQASDYKKIATALAEGKLVGVIMSKGHFTSSGHFIVLRGITEEGKILVADPSSYKRSSQEWDFEIILQEARKGAGAGGPFGSFQNKSPLHQYLSKRKENRHGKTVRGFAGKQILIERDHAHESFHAKELL